MLKVEEGGRYRRAGQGNELVHPSYERARTLSKQDSVPRKGVSRKTHGDGSAYGREGKNAPMSPTDRPWVEPYPGLLTGPPRAQPLPVCHASRGYWWVCSIRKSVLTQGYFSQSGNLTHAVCSSVGTHACRLNAWRNNSCCCSVAYEGAGAAIEPPGLLRNRTARVVPTTVGSCEVAASCVFPCWRSVPRYLSHLSISIDALTTTHQRRGFPCLCPRATGDWLIM